MATGKKKLILRPVNRQKQTNDFMLVWRKKRDYLEWRLVYLKVREKTKISILHCLLTDAC